MYFKYNHKELDILTLHALGVRNPLELEEVIEGYSVATCEYVPDVGRNIYCFIGFTKKSKPLEVAFYTNQDVDIFFVGAVVPSVKSIINDFCRFCSSTN